MGLAASMYSGTSGLKAHGEGMTVIGNNISNVSTIGYKASAMYFEDALSQSISTSSGTGQVGRGVTVGTVMGDFSQGSLESTTEATDLAIGGNGFFVVSPAGADTSYYTRAGNFRFDNDGYLVDTHGYRVQGWEVLNEDSSVAASSSSTQAATTSVQVKGVPTDIQLGNFQSPPQATTKVDMILNLDSRTSDKSTNDGDDPATDPFDGTPFTALFNSYDATATTVLGDTKYAYQSTIQVYDENGTGHDLTVYLDPVLDPDVVNNAGGKRYWEYIVTVPPGEDNREFWASQSDQSKRGVLMAGTLTFNASGELDNMSAFTINNPYLTATDGSGNPIDPAAVEPTTDATTGASVAGAFASDASRVSNWTTANFSQNGYPICTANFLGFANGSITATDSDTTDSHSPIADATKELNTPRNIEINFGLRNTSTDWTDSTGTLGDVENMFYPNGTQITTAAQAQDALKNLNGMGALESSALAMTNYSTGSTTVFQAQNGYTAGFLQNISVDRDGVITGRYSNGQVLELFALTLATFNNNYALYREGGNLYSETRSSGPPITGLANTGGKGSIASNSLEQSNVDLATEFVKMITIEKGFQANSKTITTVDNMLSTLIQLKR